MDPVFVMCHLCRKGFLPRRSRPQITPSGSKVFGRYWGLTVAQIRSFVSDCRQTGEWDDDDMNIRSFVEKFVKPRTSGTGMGLALLVNQDCPLEANTMISHCWDEHALKFFEDIQHEIKDCEVMFICFFSIYQNEDGMGPSIGEQLGSDASLGPFTDVIQHLQPKRAACDHFDQRRARQKQNSKGRMVVITSAEVALYTRLWCVWEVYVALRHGVPVTYAGHGVLFESPMATSRNARCGNPKNPINTDESMIRQWILSEPILPPHVDRLVNRFLTIFILLASVILAVYFIIFDVASVGYTVIVAGGFQVMKYIVSIGATVFLGDGFARLDSIVRKDAHHFATRQKAVVGEVITEDEIAAEPSPDNDIDASA